MGIRKFIRNWINGDLILKHNVAKSDKVRSFTPEQQLVRAMDHLHITMVRAEGGVIIQLEHRADDRQMMVEPVSVTTYVIHDGEDIGQEIAKIITMHALKS